VTGRGSAVQAEAKAASTAPSTTTPEPANRDQRPAVVYSQPLVAKRDLGPHADEAGVLPAMFDTYAAPSDLSDWRQMAAVMLGDLAGTELLDYGCGTGEAAACFARLGARVTAIDTSEVGVSALKERATHHQLDIRALEMPLDPTSFPSASFDRIHGVGILHRVGVETGLVEAWRLLRSGGVGVFLEPMGGNPAIEMARLLSMSDERFLAERDAFTSRRPATWTEIEASTRYFWRVAVHPYHLLYRLKRFIPRSMHGSVMHFDHRLLAIAPGLRRYAGAVVLRVVK
jgi:demethylmenaquinone methyltransferase/2-methoxy-6-polyprenyl-1,4-benzoquinol methylase